MTVTSVKTGADQEVHKIGLSDGSLFYIRTCYIPYLVPESLNPGSEISESEAKALRYASTCLRAEKAALRLIARSEQSYQRLLQKLEARDFTREIGIQVLEHLRAKGYVDDKRYAERWLSYRISRGGKAPRMLLSSLQRKGISRQSAEKALTAVLTPQVELELMKHCLEKYTTQPQELSVEELRRVLLKRGFTSPMVRRYLEEFR